MPNYHQDYFYLSPTGKNTPLLSYDKNQIRDTHLLFRHSPLDEDYVVSLKFGHPIPQKPKLGDVLQNAQHLVISERLKELLKSLKLKGVQFLPTEIRNPKTEEIYRNYYVLHIHNLIDCLNHEESEYDMINGKVSYIKKLVLDNDALDKVPLEERLIFALGEQRLNMFFHRSIVEKIIDIHPENMEFRCLATQEEIDKPFDSNILKYIHFKAIRREEPVIVRRDILAELKKYKFDKNGKVIGKKDN